MLQGERSTGNILTIIAYACVTFSQMAVYHWLGNEIIFMVCMLSVKCSNNYDVLQF